MSAASPLAAVALRPARLAEIAAMRALRTRCVREVCSTHYPPEAIAVWASSPAPTT